MPETPVTTHFPFFGIKAGARVTIRTPRGTERVGRAVVKTAGGWRLDITVGGEPALATAKNTIAVGKGRA